MFLTGILTVSAGLASGCLAGDLTMAIISMAGMYVGVMAKFSPFFLSSAGLSWHRRVT